MSLQVWLPLCGNTNNQGLSNVSIINNGATISTSGKIGSCYYFLRSTPNYLKIDNCFTTSSNGISMAFWVKIPSNASGNNQVIHIGNGAGWDNNRCTCFIRTGKSTIVFCCGDGTGTTSTSSTQYNCESSAITLNVWTHVACVYTPGTMQIYLNGLLDKTYTTSIIPSFTNISYIGVGAAPNGGEPATVYLNDVRLYDHSISTKEVEELAKGEIIHLKLSDPYMEATTNLATANLSNTCYNGATGKYSYGTNTDMYKDDGYYQGRTCTRVRMGTDGLDAYPYVYFDAFNATGTTIQTLSFDYFPTIQTVLIPYSYGGTYNWFWSNGVTSGTTLNSATCASIPVKLYQWNHITVTAGKYDTTNTTRGIGYIRIGSAKHTSNTTNYWLFANVQVEAKDHETGLAPFNSSRSAESIDDVSGYGHIATPNAITISTNTPRYDRSAVFNSSNSSYIKIEDNTWMADGLTEFTVSIWMKASSWPSQIRPFCCLETGGFGLGNAGDSGYYRFYVHEYQNTAHSTTGYDSNTQALKISNLSTTDWNHIAIVYTTSGTKTYLNGELHHNYIRTSYGIHFNTGARLFLGCEANAASPTTPYFNGQLSDFRLYAVALTDKEIMELYNESAAIDRAGALFAREFVEE